MIPYKIETLIQEVRTGNKTTVDFKHGVISYLEETYGLNEYQATLCYQRDEDNHAIMEFIFADAEFNAKFAERIIKSK